MMVGMKYPSKNPTPAPISNGFPNVTQSAPPITAPAAIKPIRPN
jgi:hypothetical protein